MIDKNSPIPLYLQIQSLLLDQIRAGEIKPGAQILSELEIAGRFNVSRMTARKALDALASRGIVYRRKGKGTFVSEAVMSYGLSMMLSFSKTLAARGHVVATRVLRQQVVPGPPEVLAALELPPDRPLVLVRRLRFVDGQAAAIHNAYLEYPAFAPLLERDLSVESLHDAIEQISGLRVAYSRDSVRAARAGADDARLLEIDPDDPVLHVEGVAYSESNQPTRFTRAVYRGDLFQLSVTNRAEAADTLTIASTTR